MYASVERVLIACKRARISINHKEAKHYYCEPCKIRKSTKIVSKLLLALALRPLQRIYIDGIKHKP